MAITRTNMIDDDGSGTTGTIINNAWKQEFYNQIDGLVGPIIAWTPVDQSGAGLIFTGVQATYIRIGLLISVTVNLTYPTTSNGAAASFGPLPFAPSVATGLYGVVGTRSFYLQPGDLKIIVLDRATSLNVANSQLSGTNVLVSGIYHA